VGEKLREVQNLEPLIKIGRVNVFSLKKLIIRQVLILLCTVEYQFLKHSVFFNLTKIKIKYASLCDFSISTVEWPLTDHPQGTGKSLLNGG